MRRATVLAALFAACTLAGCSGRDDSPLLVSIIGPSPQSMGTERGAHTATSRLQVEATAQGLVAFDAKGQIEPALAESWAVTDDGLSYIFRIRQGEWASRRPITSVDVANSLRASLAIRGRPDLRAFFRNIKAVIPMTAYVVEIRLNLPEPELLQLLAQPELAITRGGFGSGPYRFHSRRDRVTRFRPIDALASDPVTKVNDQSGDIRVMTEPVALTIARFRAGGSSEVIGGSFNDVLLARAANVDAARFQADPAYGLFGLLAVSDTGLLADRDMRLALSIAIDRDRIVRRFGLNDWKPALSILPAQLDSSSVPAAMQAIQDDLDARRAQARSIVRGKGAQSRQTLRVALPSTTGGRFLFAMLASDWKAVGIKAVRVAPGKPADLRLIDEVAPISSGVWYLNRLTCANGSICDSAAEAAIEAIAQSPDLPARAARIAAADVALTSAQTYFPLALPLRWSLVSPELTGWYGSAFAIHPLKHLRPNTN